MEHPANDRAPVWTPDGKEVLFLSDRTGVYSLWGVAVADGRAKGFPVLVKRNVGPILPMGMTTLGAYYYGANNGNSDVYVAELDPATGEVVSPPHLASRTLVGASRSPDWSPDGTQLAYVSQPVPVGFGTDPSALVILSLDTGQQRQLLPRLGGLGRLRWSPDGLSIMALGRDVAYRLGTFRIDVQTGKVTPIVHTSLIEGPWQQIEWIADGKSVIHSQHGRTLLRNLETGQERELCQAMEFALSRDGKWLAFDDEDRPAKSSVLKVMPVDGGPARELFRLPGSGEFTLGLAWSKDGRYLIFVREGLPSGTRELWRIPVTGGEPQRLKIAMPNLLSVRIHPDGRHIVFTAGAPKPEIWAMENLLPALQTAFRSERDTPQLPTKKSASKRTPVN